MNNHVKFWITLGSLITFITLFLFMLFVGAKEEIIFRKEYCLLIIPILIYNAFQFIINYYTLTEHENK